jgi:Fur family ferric uptake transcriptional regulator
MVDLQEELKKSNLKSTRARVTLLEIFRKAQKPLSYEEIRPQIAMDKATFYRNITLFEAAGLLNSFESNDKKRYFELKKRPHAHFVCRICKGVECLEGLDIGLPGYEVENVIVNGVCKECGKDPF